MVEDGKKEVAGSAPSAGFFKDPVKVGMALVIILLLAYIVIILNSQQQPGGSSQTSTSGNQTTSLGTGQPASSVNLTIVNDDSCLLCNPSGVVNSLSNTVSNLKVTNVSYSSEEGKALLKQYNATGVPLYVFDSSIERDPSYGNLSSYLIPSGSTYMLMVQPVELLGMTEQNNMIQLFVMSQGQYGVAAENNVKEVLDALPDLKFGGIYFLAEDLGNGTFSSPDGPAEVAEDLRQVCIMNYYPEEILNYTACISADYNDSGSIWQNCSSSNGIDTTMIQECSTGNEGSALLSGNIAVSNYLGIYTSPTILLNNNTLINSNYASSAEIIKDIVCAYNPLNGCNKTLSGASVTNMGV